MAGGYTYCWFGRSDGYHAQGVAVAVSNKLTPMIIEVTPVIVTNSRDKVVSIMIIEKSSLLGVVFLISVYSPTEASNLTMKNAFYATL